MVESLMCPHCGVALSLALVIPGSNSPLEVTQRPEPFPKAPMKHTFTIAGHQIELADKDIEDAAPHVRRPIFDAYVEMRDSLGTISEFPSKNLVQQAILRKYEELGSEALQPSHGFQTQRAEQILRRLGFTPKRKRPRIN